MISDLAGTGLTVFLTTQTLDEADRLADRIAIMDGGRLVAEGTPAELKQRLGETYLELTLADRTAYDRLLLALGDRALAADPLRRLITVPTNGGAAQVRALLDELDPGRTAIEKFGLHSASLDDVFLSLTGHPTQETTTKETADV